MNNIESNNTLKFNASIIQIWFSFIIDIFLISIITEQLQFFVENNRLVFILRILISILYFLFNLISLKQTLGNRICGIILHFNSSNVKRNYIIYSIVFGISVAFVLGSSQYFLLVKNSILIIISYIYELVVFSLVFSIFFFPPFHQQNRSPIDVLTKSIFINKKFNLNNEITLIKMSKKLVYFLLFAFLFFTFSAILDFTNYNQYIFSDVKDHIKLNSKLKEKFNKDFNSFTKINFDLNKKVKEKYIELFVDLKPNDDESSEYFKQITFESYSLMSAYFSDSSIKFYKIHFVKPIRVFYVFTAKKEIELDPEPVHNLTTEEYKFYSLLYGNILDEAKILGIKLCTSGSGIVCADSSNLYLNLKKYDDALQNGLKGCDLRVGSACYNAACAYCNLNNSKDALVLLKKSMVIKKESGQIFDKKHASNDPDLLCLKNNSEFMELIK